MNKFEATKTICIVSLIISIFLFFIFFLSANLAGGCYIKTDISNINTNNLSVRIEPGTCVERFEIINQEENLELYAIKGDFIKYDRDKVELKNTTICLNRINLIHTDLLGELPQVTNIESCHPVKLEMNQKYTIHEVNNEWELFTNKGTITGQVKYSNSSVEVNKTILNVLKFTGTLFIISLIILIIQKKKKS